MRPARGSVWLVAFAVATGFGSTAKASEPAPAPVRLVTTAGAGTESCPRDPYLASAVIARLGYDPFSRDAARLALVEIGVARLELVARVRILAEDGSTEGERELRGANGACREVLDSVALTLAIAIDPLAIHGPRPPAAAPPPTSAVEAPAPAAPPSVVAAQPPPPPPPPPPADPRGARVVIGLVGSAGAGPSPTAGALLGVELARTTARLGLEARVDLPATGGGAVARPVGSVAVGTLAGCLGRVFVGCGLATAGVARVTSEGGTSRAVGYPFFAATGLRGLVDVPLARSVAVRPFVEVEAVLTRHTLRIDGEPRYTFPVVMGAIGLAGTFRVDE